MDASSLRILTPFSPFRMRSTKAPLFGSLYLAHVNRKVRLSLHSTRFSALCSLTDGGKELGVVEAAKEVSQNKILQVVLVSPQIPGNTGCIARTCAASAVGLHLVGPLGFKVDDAKLKRAGLDYWPYVVVKVHSSWAEFQDYFRQQEESLIILGLGSLDFSYRRGDFLIFGSETSGLPPEVLQDCKSETFGGGTIRIPMVETYVRCLNLSVSVGIALYEASRQLSYEQLQFSNENCIDHEQSFVTEDIFA
ncbi:unnamed protein product [Prunus armeniaca]|uniref:tRNA/rRNA methyltransferase SpoU type domain-containing protein n=1 Tax=Prunus armeniaca TaxID=36596 RepID=A0A6J5TXW1_PRUAR|nr:unnamed protein product [Prunus armeniaca]